MVIHKLTFMVIHKLTFMAGLHSSLPRSAAQLSDTIQELLNLAPGKRQFQEALKKMREVSNSVETGQVRGREER